MQTGKHNPRIKYLRRLASRRFRESEGRFLVEGVRFVEEALDSGWRVETVVYSREMAVTARGQALISKASASGIDLLETEQKLFTQLAETATPQGILAVLRKPEMLLEDFQMSGTALLVVVDGVQDPGNLGTIIRSSDAAGAAGAILLKDTVDLYNPRTLRATMGSLFRVPVVQGISAVDAATYLKKMEIKAVAGDPRAARPLYESDLRGPAALVVGSEAGGISAAMLEMVDEMVQIPMPGRAESLNVAVSAAILLYEAVRQRVGGLRR